MRYNETSIWVESEICEKLGNQHITKNDIIKLYGLISYYRNHGNHLEQLMSFDRFHGNPVVYDRLPSSYFPTGHPKINPPPPKNSIKCVKSGLTAITVYPALRKINHCYAKCVNGTFLSCAVFKIHHLIPPPSEATKASRQKVYLHFL